jgi:ABC-type branched-subunit amino acid transport system ATPase component
MALSIAQHGYALETGRVVLEGDCKDLSIDKQVKKVYLGQ